MNRDIFDQQIRRMQARWKNAFDIEFVSLLALKMSQVNNEAFVETVNQFVGNRPVSKPPLIQDFIDATRGSNRAKKKYAYGDIQPKEIAQCWDCGDSGFIRILRNEVYEAWAKCAHGSAPCHCARGRGAIEAAARIPKGPIDLGPQFNNSWLKSYSKMPAYDR